MIPKKACPVKAECKALQEKLSGKFECHQVCTWNDKAETPS